MKKFISSLIIAFFFSTTIAFATSYTAPFPNEQIGGIIFSGHWNSNIQSVQTFLNNNNLDSATNIAVGGISTAALANSSVTDVKIAGITTAGKVNGSAFTGLNNIPSGANIIPIANLASGTANGTKFIRDDGTLQSPLGPAFDVTNSTTQSIPNSLVFTKVTFDTENIDTNSNFASSRFTPTVSGNYEISAVVNSGNMNSGKELELAIYKNGSLFKVIIGASAIVSVMGLSASTVVTMNGSTDFIELFVAQGDTGSINLSGTTSLTFNGYRVSA